MPNVNITKMHWFRGAQVTKATVNIETDDITPYNPLNKIAKGVIMLKR